MKFLVAFSLLAAILFGGRFIPIGFPFSGPGITSDTNDSQDREVKLIAVATSGKINFGKGRRFFSDLNATMESIREHEGLVGYAARKQLIGSKVWTVSVWRDKAALRRFVRSDAHQAAIEGGSISRESVRSAMFEVEPGDLPIPWKSVVEALKTQEG
ncbi:MAG: antibiotic biosynthesis monooxygenase [Verrucomicrobiota bacterium]